MKDDGDWKTALDTKDSRPSTKAAFGDSVKTWTARVPDNVKLANKGMIIASGGVSPYHQSSGHPTKHWTSA